jgi:hypothetical protein
MMLWKRILPVPDQITMKRAQVIFIIIAFVYLFARLSQLFQPYFSSEQSIVIPGWHTTLVNTTVFDSFFAVVYFFAVGIIYALVDLPRRNAFLFYVHAVLSLLPAIITLCWQLFFPAGRMSFNMNLVIREYQVAAWLDIFFIGTQALFVLVMMFLIWKNKIQPAKNGIPN